jgi:hypothetical protein
MTTVDPRVAELLPNLHEAAPGGRLSAALVEHDGELFVEFRGGKYGAAQIAADSHITPVERVKGHWKGLWEDAFKRGATYVEGTLADLAEMADYFERLDHSNFMVPGPSDQTEAQYNFSERALKRSLDALARKVRKALPRRFF